MWKKGLIALLLLFTSCSISKNGGDCDNLYIKNISRMEKGNFTYGIGPETGTSVCIYITSPIKFNLGDKIIIAIEKEDGTIKKF